MASTPTPVGVTTPRPVTATRLMTTPPRRRAYSASSRAMSSATVGMSWTSRSGRTGEDQPLLDVATLGHLELVDDAVLLVTLLEAGDALLDRRVVLRLRALPERVLERAAGQPDGALDEHDLVGCRVHVHLLEGLRVPRTRPWRRIGCPSARRPRPASRTSLMSRPVTTPPAPMTGMLDRLDDLRQQVAHQPVRAEMPAGLEALDDDRGCAELLGRAWRPGRSRRSAPSGTPASRHHVKTSREKPAPAMTRSMPSSSAVWTSSLNCPHGDHDVDADDAVGERRGPCGSRRAARRAYRPLPAMMPMPPASATAAASGDSEMRTAMPPWMMGSRAVRFPIVSVGISTCARPFGGSQGRGARDYTRWPSCGRRVETCVGTSRWTSM